jgi:hypothetical protein
MAVPEEMMKARNQLERKIQSVINKFEKKYPLFEVLYVDILVEDMEDGDDKTPIIEVGIQKRDKT